MSELSPYEIDLQGQPDALRAVATGCLPGELGALRIEDYPRVVVTGMGSSHFAGLPLWRRLVKMGWPAWWISTTELLDSPDLVTEDSLLVATSQSGLSGEVVALLDGAAVRPRTVIGVTADDASPLACSADVTVALRSGTEATVSSKSYLNTLATHRLVLAALGRDERRAVEGDAVRSDVTAAADDLAGRAASTVVTRVAQRAVEGPDTRVALVGKGDDAAAALLGGLIFKEAAKVAAEGYVGGAFRHGPLELAGPGLTAVLFGGADGGLDPSLAALAGELVAAGSQVLVVGGQPVPGCLHQPVPHPSPLRHLVLATAVVQDLSVALARAKGLVPGEFAFGQKVTSTL